MDILPQPFEYDLLSILFASRIIPELDEHPAVFAMGLEGEYLEVTGIDIGEEITKMVEEGGFTCIAYVCPWAVVKVCWTLSLSCTRCKLTPIAQEKPGRQNQPTANPPSTAPMS